MDPSCKIGEQYSKKERSWYLSFSVELWKGQLVRASSETLFYFLCSALTFRSYAQSIYFVKFSGGASSLFTLFRKKRWKRWLNSGFLKTNEGRKRTKHARSFAQVSFHTILNTTYCVNHNQLHGHSIRSEPRWTCSPTWARSSLCRWRWAVSWLVCRVADQGVFVGSKIPLESYLNRIFLDQSYN